MADELKVPAAPAMLPVNLKKKWAATYTEAFKEAQASGQGNEGDWHQAARCEANRLLRVPEPKTYEDAVALADWQCHARETNKQGTVSGVTIDGKKFRFDAPPKKQAEGGKQQAPPPAA